MNRLLVIVALLSLSGCAISVKEFRERPAAYMAELPAKAQPMANCMMHRLEETIPNAPSDMFRVTTEGNRTSLILSQQVPSAPFMVQLSPMAELVFTQTSPSQVLLESRSRFPAGSNYIDDAKPFVAICAQQSLTS